jgi:hypothetical protein
LARMGRPLHRCRPGRETTPGRRPLRPPAQTWQHRPEPSWCCLARLRCPGLDKVRVDVWSGARTEHRDEGAAAQTGQAGRVVKEVAAAAAPSPELVAHQLPSEELVWLEGIRKLHTKADKVLSDAPSDMTSSTMGTLAAKMGSCSRDLARLGAPTERLRPVYKLAKSVLPTFGWFLPFGLVRGMIRGHDRC